MDIKMTFKIKYNNYVKFKFAKDKVTKILHQISGIYHDIFVLINLLSNEDFSFTLCCWWKKIQTIDIVGLSNDLFNKTKDSTLQSRIVPME